MYSNLEILIVTMEYMLFFANRGRVLLGESDVTRYLHLFIVLSFFKVSHLFFTYMCVSAELPSKDPQRFSLFFKLISRKRLHNSYQTIRKQDPKMAPPLSLQAKRWRTIIVTLPIMGATSCKLLKKISKYSDAKADIVVALQ